jgi:23S rRNA A2030 N6-methylase RlmJ
MQDEISEINAEDRLEAYDPGTEFADRVMREAFDRMTKGELKDYDSKAMKPGSIRLSTPEERKKYAKVFQQSRGGAGEKVKKLRDLRKP